MILCLILGSYAIRAQTPVQDLMDRYRNVSGADYFEASGIKMVLVRPALMASPLSPLAYDVQSLRVLQMDKASEASRQKFEDALSESLLSYDKYGEHESPNGMVMVYVMFAGKDKVSELVIFNPARCALNDIVGPFSVQSLEKLQ